MYATSRDAEKRERIAALGATAVEPGARLPERVDVVIETVGAATFDHSLKCAAPGARIVVSGATSGHLPKVAPETAPGAAHLSWRRAAADRLNHHVHRSSSRRLGCRADGSPLPLAPGLTRLLPRACPPGRHTQHT